MPDGGESNNERTTMDTQTTARELAAEIDALMERTRDVSATLSAAYEPWAEDDDEALELYEAEEIVTGTLARLAEARRKVATWSGLRSFIETPVS